MGIENIAAQFEEHHQAVMRIVDRVEKLERGFNDQSNHALVANMGLLNSSRRSPEAIRAMGTMSEFMRRGTPMNANTTGTADASGGYSVPLEFDSMIYDRLLAANPVRQVARVVRTSSPNFRSLVGVRGTGSGWVGETDTRTETDSPQMDRVEPTTGTLYAYPKATEEILNDSFFDIAEWLLQNIVDEMALQETIAFTSGNGTKKPTGFLNGTPVSTADASRAFGTLQYVPSGSASAITADALVTLVYTVSSPYRTGAAWQMNSATIATIRKLKDGQGNYLWQPSTMAGQPDMLMGYPVYANEQMPDIAGNAFPIAFGNWQRGYIITDLADTRVTRDEVTSPGWVKFYVRRRVGGKVHDSNALKLLKVATS